MIPTYVFSFISVLHSCIYPPIIQVLFWKNATSQFFASTLRENWIFFEKFGERIITDTFDWQVWLSLSLSLSLS